MVLNREELADKQSTFCPEEKCSGVLDFGLLTPECPVCRQQFMAALLWPDALDDLKQKETE